MSKLLRYLLGAPVFGIGMALAILEVWRLYQNNVNIHISHVIVSLVFMYIGGAIINSVLAETIADNLVETLSPLLDRLPGGKRKTDPPPPPPVPTPEG